MMNQLPDKIEDRLLFIIYHGLTEIRNLALASDNEQIADLADALEPLARYVSKCSADDMELIRFVLKGYQTKYPGRPFDYLAHLDVYAPPERF